MSTCRDLARFFRELLRGHVFGSPETLRTMTTTLEGVPRAPLTSGDPVRNAAMFLFRAEIGGETWWGHDGYWGTSAYSCPARDVTILAGHQRSDMPENFDRMAIFTEAFGLVARD
jgi:CubicO group peptidase (beta-lactamase class C family)